MIDINNLSHGDKDILRMKAYIIKDKVIADITSIDFESAIIEVRYPDEFDIKSFVLDDVHIMRYTGKKDINEDDVYEGHALYRVGTGHLLGIKSYNANGSCPFNLYNKTLGSYDKSRVSWQFVQSSLIIGTIWDDKDELIEKGKEMNKKITVLKGEYVHGNNKR